MLKQFGFAIVAVAFAVSGAQAQSTTRTELTKADLTGTNMEIVMSIVEVPPGATSPLHTHPGEEAYYVLDGATAVFADGKRYSFVAGTGKINVREIPHSGFTVTGDKTLKLLTVHIVDKGKPMTTLVTASKP